MTNWTPAQMPSLTDSTVVVTGANSGLGYEGTRQFARRGATVVMACRSLDRARSAKQQIEADNQFHEEAALDVRECDLASLDSVRTFADGMADAYDSVDILCNNAGVMAIPRRETEDGFEMQLGVNHFGHFALTGRLFSLLTAGADTARVVTQSSGMHERGEMDFADLNWEESYSKWDAYGRSKLANVLFAYELQRRLDHTGEDGVTSHACHPGYADTGLQGRSASESSNPLAGPLMKVANTVFAQSAEKGAYPMLYAATADLDGGEYVGPDGFLSMRGRPEIQESSAASYDEDDARQLWEQSVEMTGVEYPLEAPAQTTP